MKKVESLRYGVVFKKAFCDPEIFKGFIRDALGIQLEIDYVETEKTFDPPIGKVRPRFDLFAEDVKNRVIVDIQHARFGDHYQKDISVIDFDPKDLSGKPLGEIPHKVMYICPKYVNDKTPEPIRQ